MDIGVIIKSCISSIWRVMSTPINFSFLGVSYGMSLVFIEVGILILALALIIINRLK